jgi:MFS family permease
MSLPLRLAAFYFAYFAYAGAFIAYLPLYFAWRGLRAGEIAFLLALPQIARVFAPAAWGWLADRSGAQRGIVVFACAANAACFTVLPYAGGARDVAWLIGAMSLLSAGAIPLVEAITLGSLAGQAGRYGPIRLWGSFGFIAAVLGGGAWLDFQPVRGLPSALVALSLAALAVSLVLPAGKAHAEAQSTRLRLSPAMQALLAAGFCMAAAHGTLYTFFTLHLEGLGYSGTLIGTLWTLGVLAEIVVFLYAGAFPAPHALGNPGLELPVRGAAVHRHRLGGRRALGPGRSATAARRHLRRVPCRFGRRRSPCVSAGRPGARADPILEPVLRRRRRGRRTGCGLGLGSLGRRPRIQRVGARRAGGGAFRAQAETSRSLR